MVQIERRPFCKTAYWFLFRFRFAVLHIESPSSKYKRRVSRLQIAWIFPYDLFLESFRFHRYDLGDLLQVLNVA